MAANVARDTRRSDATRATILEAAQGHFARSGYEKATIRAIAATAGIDPSLVMRYYGNKEKLFAAAANFDIRMPDLATVPPVERGAALVGHFLTRWEADDTMVALLRAATSYESAGERMVEIFSTQMLPAVSRVTVDHTQERAALIGAQMIGFAVCRYILRLPPVAEMAREQAIGWLAPTVQHYLDTPAPC